MNPSGTVPERSASLRSYLRWLPGLVVTGLAIWFLARSVDWPGFFHTLVNFPPLILLLTAFLYLVTMFTRALCWHSLLQRKVSILVTVLVLNEGYFLNNILPFRMGELGRAWLMGQRSKLGTLNVLSTIVVERAYDMVFAASLLLTTLPLVLKMEEARPVVTLLLIGMLAGLFAVYLTARNRAWLEGLLKRWSTRWPFIERWVIPPVHSLLDGFSVLARPEYFVVSFLLLGISWALSIVRDWALIGALSPGAPLWWAILAISASNLGGALPSAMASLGVFEAAAVAALSLVGVTAEAALAYALIVHITHLIFTSLIGAYGLSQEGKSLAELYSVLRSANRPS